ncbi:zinc finger protein 277-like isoform X2 [Mytilus trossulus]|uniref:zinc finger protein 277-like isoform X1 n=1 Tax=Mytilus trossulus TaxID=6551 RepID=UPI00300605E7
MMHTNFPNLFINYSLRNFKMSAPTAADSTVAEKLVLECLSLSHIDGDSTELNDRVVFSCLFCNQTFDEKDNVQRHLVKEHKLVIADVNLISHFQRYLLYWKARFKEQPVEDFCSIILTNSGDKDEGPKDQYYLLSDVLSEDKSLRNFLQKKTLEDVLSIQQKERDNSLPARDCLFCREKLEGNRALLFDHMAHDHGFNVGLPDNIVYKDEFLDLLQEQLNNLNCLYCEKTFRDRTVLKEHMRKKQHRKINPNNKVYDRFYMINYLELGKNWEAIQSEDDTAIDNDAESEKEEDYSDWEEVGAQAVCLYCEFSSSIPDKLHAHMQELHDLDLKEIKLRLNLNFYQQVKLINYIRRQVHLGICIGCQEKFEDIKTLTDHMHEKGHTHVIPDLLTWDQPQYFFPTYENDNLLCQLEDDDNDQQMNQDGSTTSCHGNVTVIAEDNPVENTILTDEKLRREILMS